MFESMFIRKVCIGDNSTISGKGGIGGITPEEIRERYGVKEVHKLSANENQLGPSPKAMQAMLEAMSKVSTYGTSDPELREKLAEKLHLSEFGLSAENIVLTTGASQALDTVIDSVAGDGDEVLTCEPYYPGYRSAVARSGADLVTIPIRADRHQDLKGLLKAIRPETKAVLVCNPNNPTGVLENQDELETFIRAFPKDRLLLLDEAYIQFAPKDGCPSMVHMIADDRPLVIAQTFSKIYGLAGLRMGYIITNRELADCYRRRGGCFMGILPTVAAIAALDDTEFEQKTLAMVTEGREYLMKSFREMGFDPYPSASNFIYCDFGVPAAELAERLWKKGFIIRGNMPLSRVSVGRMDQNTAFVQALKEVLAEK